VTGFLATPYRRSTLPVKAPFLPLLCRRYAVPPTFPPDLLTCLTKNGCYAGPVLLGRNFSAFLHCLCGNVGSRWISSGRNFLFFSWKLLPPQTRGVDSALTSPITLASSPPRLRMPRTHHYGVFTMPVPKVWETPLYPLVWGDRCSLRPSPFESVSPTSRDRSSARRIPPPPHQLGACLSTSHVVKCKFSEAMSISLFPFYYRICIWKVRNQPNRSLFAVVPFGGHAFPFRSE